MPPEPTEESLMPLFQAAESAILTARTTALSHELVKAVATVYAARITSDTQGFTSDHQTRQAARGDVADFLKMFCGQ